MKLQLLSDLHLSVCPMEPPHTDADVVVLAGDLHRPEGAMAWARQLDKPTVFVAGNHEFYGGDLVTTVDQLREHAAGTSIQMLERQSWCHAGVRFLGCTLWSDYRLYADDDERERGLAQAMQLVRDFSRIHAAPDAGQKFTPDLSQRIFDDSVAWLDAQFAQVHDGPTVVVTHFAPSRGSIHERFAGSALNACFVSDLERHIARWQPQLWLHGHVHDSFDYRLGRTRVVANPRGYAPAGRIENPAFDPGFVIDVG